MLSFLILSIHLVNDMSWLSKILSSLSGSLVRSHLQSNHAFSCLQLLFSETAHIFRCFLRSNSWLSEIRRFSPEWLQTDDNRIQVLTFPQVDRLKLFLRWDAKLGDFCQKVVDVLHTLESHLRLVHFANWIGLQTIDKSTVRSKVRNQFIKIKSQIIFDSCLRCETHLQRRVPSFSTV